MGLCLYMRAPSFYVNNFFLEISLFPPKNKRATPYSSNLSKVQINNPTRHDYQLSKKAVHNIFKFINLGSEGEDESLFLGFLEEFLSNFGKSGY